MNRNKLLMAVVGALLLPLGSVAQTNSVSPYSRFGFGDAYPQVYARSLGFGGASMALPDALNLNFDNPAIFSALELTTFQVGFEASLIEQRQTNPDVLVNNSRSGMRYFAFGVPLTKWWGSGLAIQPYSFKGYQISTERSVASDPNELITDTYTGQGGLNRLVWGNAFEVAKNLSFGVNASYIFGSLREFNTVNFNNPDFLDTRTESESLISDIVLEYGLQYRLDLPENYFLGLGFSFQNSGELSSNNRSYQYSINGNLPIDTLRGAAENSRPWQLPSEWRGGLSFGKQNENAYQPAWAFNVDFEQYRGSEFENANGSRPLNDAWRLQAGGFITPKYTFDQLERNGGFLSAIEYRLGGFYNKMPISLSETDLYDYGITFGLGIPVRQRNLAPGEYKVNTINIGAILGRRGSLENNLIQEQYLSLYIGVSFNDKWFIQYKYR